MKNNLIKYLVEFEYSNEYKEAFVCAMDKLLSSSDAEAALLGHIDEYKRGNLNWDAISADAVKYAELTDIHEYTARFLFYTALIPYSYHFFEERGLGYTEWYDSMIDFKWKVDECVKCYGVIGVFVDWFKSFFTAERVAFGRLQFNLVDADYDYKTCQFDISIGCIGRFLENRNEKGIGRRFPRRRAADVYRCKKVCQQIFLISR